VANYILTIRPQEYNEDRLFKVRGRRTKAGSKRAIEEYERRNGIRQGYHRLSRYYKLEGVRTEWNAPQLLSRGKQEFVTRHQCVLLTSSPSVLKDLATG